MIWPLFFIAGIVVLGSGLGLVLGEELAPLKRWLTLNPAKQMQMAALIMRRFRSAGYPTNLGIAAVVNAYFESRLDPIVVFGRTPFSENAGVPQGGGNVENSVGLFQLNSAPGAAGAGMTVKQRQDPNKNISRILEVIEGPAGLEIRNNLDGSIGQLTYLFTLHIERPAYAANKATERQDFASSLFGIGRSGGRTF